MTEINPVSLLGQMQTLANKAQGGSVENTGTGLQFGTILQKTLNDVNAIDQHANGLKTRFELGDSKVGIAEVMVASQKATVSLQAALAVRNKLVSTYQDIMNMPI